MLCIRITNTYTQLSDFCKRLIPVCDKVVIYEHEASRVHIHGLLINCKVSTDTLKNWIKKDLKVSAYPKSDWSFTVGQDDGFITYMTKGLLNPKFVHGYTDEFLEAKRTSWVPVEKRKAEKTQYKLKSENPTEAKFRQNELMQMVKDRCKANDWSSMDQILTCIRQVVYVEHKTIVGRYKIRDFYDYVLSDLDPKTWLREMEKICCNRT